MKYSKEELIWKYLDGDCTSSESAFFEGELGSDPKFKAEYEAAKKVHELMDANGVVPAPDGFSSRVMARIAVTPLPQTVEKLLPKGFFYRLGLIPAGIAMLAILMMIVNPGNSGSGSVFSEYLPDLDLSGLDSGLSSPAMTLLAAVAVVFPLLVGLDSLFRKKLNS